MGEYGVLVTESGHLAVISIKRKNGKGLAETEYGVFDLDACTRQRHEASDCIYYLDRLEAVA